MASSPEQNAATAGKLASETTAIRRSLEDRNAVASFVARHFSLRGTLRLHRMALGADLLRAPINVLLAPMFLLTRIAALFFCMLGFSRFARVLRSRRIILPTQVAKAVETAVREELVIPRLQANARLSQIQQRMIEDYAGIRSAVSEICVTALVLLVGFTVFRVATPGIISLAPALSDFAARTSAEAGFPFGARLGGLWYGMFPVDVPVWYVLGTGMGLAVLASLVATFAGLIADPVQAWLGIHHRRLLRLLARIDAEDVSKAGLGPEHLVARSGDVVDAVVSLFRVFRP